MKYYRILDILHSGQRGKRGTTRTDGRYPLRIGRVVELDVNNLVIDIPFILNYIKDENGEDYRGYYLQTSRIVNWTLNKNILCIETENSIYELIEVH